MTGRLDTPAGPDAPRATEYEWRLEQLRRAGYADARARELAGRSDVDLHVACDLVARGCPERTAYEILA